MTNPKLLILGHARHGKDTVAEQLRDEYGFAFVSSSVFVGEEVMWDNWGVAKYPDFDAMFADKVNHRVLWMEMISAYNTPDKTKTATTMIERGFDLYVGMRRVDELEACKAAGIFDAIIWVDALDRLPAETGSMDITAENCGADFVINNNGPEEDLPALVANMMQELLQKTQTDKARDFIHECSKKVLADTIASLAAGLGLNGFANGGPIQSPNRHAMPAAFDTVEPSGELRHNEIEPDIEDITEVVIIVGEPDPTLIYDALRIADAVVFVSEEADIEAVIRQGWTPSEDDYDWNPIDDEDDFNIFASDGPEAVIPVFKSTRSRVGDVEEQKTTAEGVTTIINIENLYMPQGD